MPPATGPTAGYPTTQGVPPAYGAPPGAPPPWGGLFKLGKGKTIGIAVGALVVLGAIGALAAAAFGGEEDTPTATDVPNPSGTLAPSPVTTTAPASPPPTTPASPPATTVTNPPTTPPTTAPPPPSGDSVTLAGGTAIVPVPAGWEVSHQDETTVSLNSDKNLYLFVAVGSGVDPASDAAVSVANTASRVLTADNGYSQIQIGAAESFEPLGSVVNSARILYKGLWSDNQGTYEIGGAMWSLVRPDGFAMFVLLEGSPPKALSDHQNEYVPILETTFGTFAGLG
jgi:hypothetical protein